MIGATKRWLLLCVGGCLAALVSTACGSGSSGGGPDIVLTGAVAADPIAVSTGVGSYDVARGSAGVEVTVYGLDGERLGLALLTPGPGGLIHLNFGPSPGTGLEVAVAAFGSHSLDEIDDAALVGWSLMGGGLGGAGSIGLTARGNGVAGGAWLEELTLEAGITSGAAPPALGGSYPTSASGTTLTLPLVRGGELVADLAEVIAWLEALDLGALRAHGSAGIVMSMLHDQSLFEALLVEGAAQESEVSGARASLTLRAIHLGPVCEELLADQGRVRAAVREACADACRLPNRHNLPVQPLLSLLVDPICVSCIYRHPYLRWTERCLRARESAVDDAWCETNYQGCLAGTVPRADITEHKCECRCLQQTCEEFCSSLTGLGGFQAAGSPSCASRAECGCALDGNAWCEQRWGDYYCGGAEFLGLRQGFDCVTAACGDGEIARTCPANPSLQEECDASSPLEGDTCPAGFECVGCVCQSCELSVRCGDGRISTNCPGFVEECDPAATPTGCPAGERCELCGCVPEQRCGNGRVDPGEQCERASDCQAAGASCVDCQCLSGPPPPGGLQGRCSPSGTGCATLTGSSYANASNAASFCSSLSSTFEAGVACPAAASLGACVIGEGTNAEWMAVSYHYGPAEERATALAQAQASCSVAMGRWVSPYVPPS